MVIKVHQKCIVWFRHPIRVILSGARYHTSDRTHEPWLKDSSYAPMIQKAYDSVLFELKHAGAETIMAMLAEGEYVIECQLQSKRAQRYIRLQLFPSTCR